MMTSMSGETVENTEEVDPNQLSFDDVASEETEEQLELTPEAASVAVEEAPFDGPENGVIERTELMAEGAVMGEDATGKDVHFQLEELEFASGKGDIQVPEGPPPITIGEQVVQQIEAIPQKMAFKIGEVAEMLGVKQYVLRYWESEFEALRPRKSKNNQRVFTRKDVETVMLIKKLLYEDRFSIEGARAALRQAKQQVKVEKDLKGLGETQNRAIHRLYSLVEDIQHLKALLL